MTVMVAHLGNGQIVSVIIETASVDRWLAEREEARAILGIQRVDRIDLEPQDFE
jgi:hypothetical protein